MKKNVEKEFSKIINDKKDGDISRNYEVIDQTLGHIKFHPIQRNYHQLTMEFILSTLNIIGIIEVL